MKGWTPGASFWSMKIHLFFYVEHIWNLLFVTEWSNSISCMLSRLANINLHHCILHTHKLSFNNNESNESNCCGSPLLFFEAYATWRFCRWGSNQRHHGWGRVESIKSTVGVLGGTRAWRGSWWQEFPWSCGKVQQTWNRLKIANVLMEKREYQFSSGVDFHPF